MKQSLGLLSVVFLLILFSCGRGTNNKLAMNEISLPDELAGRAAFNSQGEAPVQAVIERKIIRTGQISFETTDVNSTRNHVEIAVKDAGGYISGDNIYNTDERITHRIVVRVPAPAFDRLLINISSTAKKIESKTVDASDVTEEYIDIEARIKTKKDLENRYRELLAKAKTVEEMLSIEKEMGTLRTEIESIEGRLRYLKDQVSQSTLTVEFWQRTGTSFDFGSKTGQALLSGWKWLLAFIIGVIHFWPFILIALIIVTLSFRLSRKSAKKK